MYNTDMLLVNEFKVGQKVQIDPEGKSDLFPNDGSSVRSGVDVTHDEDFPFDYPIKADVAGLEGSVVTPDAGMGGGRAIVELEYEPGRIANFILPIDMCFEM